jgi:hypothetical protein
VHCLRSLGSRDRGFESHSGHGCLVFVYVCPFFCVCVQVEALRRANHPSKETYRLSLIKKLRKLSPMLQKREQAPTCGSNEEGKKIVVLTTVTMNNTIFCVVTPHSSKTARSFEITCFLHLQGRIIDQAGDKLSSCLMRGGEDETLQRMYCYRHSEVDAFISEKDGLIYFCKRDCVFSRSVL